METLGRLAALTASVERSTEQRGKRAAAGRTGRADPRAARERDPAALRGGAGDRLRARPDRGGAAPLPGGAALGGRRPADGADPAGRRGRPGRRQAGLDKMLARLRSAGRSCGSTGRRGSRSRPTSSRSPSRSSPRRCATPTATRSRARSRSASPPTARPSRLAIENDGAGDGKSTRGGGLGLRLAALEALRYEGLVEFGAAPGGRWRVRLVVPVGS